MEQELVSIVMSIYNESEEELIKSIDSVLSQTYENIELIIVNDNPARDVNQKVLAGINNAKVKIHHNEKNIGLVKSLNTALSLASGSYIARMDADDISRNDRIEKQLAYLKNGGFDLIGSWIELINERDETIGEMTFPISCKCVDKTLKYGGCVAHPSWLAKREVYDTLKGYRLVPHCEDYDFLNRALINGFKLGNIPEKCLKYRLRETSVSVTNKTHQLVLRRYLSKNRARLDQISEEDISRYLSSDEFNKKLNRLMKYEDTKKGLRNKNILCAFKLIFSSEFYIYLVEKNVPKLYMNK